MSFGPNIQAARKRAGLTQEQLAKKCNMATITIRQYESGKREPRIKQLQDIANALGVHVLELLGYPAFLKYQVDLDIKFSVNAMARNIHKKYNIPEAVAKCIVEDCYAAFQMDGTHKTEAASMAELFDSLDPEEQKSALSYLRFLIQEGSPEGPSGEC